MGLCAPSLLRPIGRYRAACEYCKGDPVRAVCVNCGAPQAPALHRTPVYEYLEVEAVVTEDFDLIEVTTLGDSERKYIQVRQPAPIYR